MWKVHILIRDITVSRIFVGRESVADTHWKVLGDLGI